MIWYDEKILLKHEHFCIKSYHETELKIIVVTTSSRYNQK